MTRVTRRQFGTTTAALLATAASATRVRGANDRVHLGFIGLGNRGDQVLDAFLAHKDAEVVAVCDIHEPYANFAAQKAGGHPARHQDYRRLLESKDIDAIVISTPDHWHALQMIQACEAGKDVYVEKPLSLVVSEGRAMVSAARRHDRVVQVGIHRRSAAFVKEAADLVRGGAVGTVTVARAFHVQNEWPRGIGAPPDEAPPAGFDWDAWLGPAPMRPYNKNRTFYRFRWFRDYSGGQVTNFGVHYIDAIQWALGHRAAGGDGDGRQGGDRGQPRDPGHARGTVDVSGRHAGHFLAVQRDGSAGGQGPPRRDRVPRHQGDALSLRRRLRDCARCHHAE